MNSKHDVHLYDYVAELQERLGPEKLARLRPTIEGVDAEQRFTELVQHRVRFRGARTTRRRHRGRLGSAIVAAGGDQS